VSAGVVVAVATDVVNKGVRLLAEKLRPCLIRSAPMSPAMVPIAQARLNTYNAAGGGLNAKRSLSRSAQHGVPPEPSLHHSQPARSLPAEAVAEIISMARQGQEAHSSFIVRSPNLIAAVLPLPGALDSSQSESRPRGIRRALTK